jgi:DNA-binding CsgD family transcriptional regulator
LVLLCSTIALMAQPSGNPLLQKGWAALVKDHDSDAFRDFWAAYEQAQKQNNAADKAESLLYLGICSFGSSLEKGLQFATQSLSEYKKLETSNPKLAKIGRSKCLQLISTIYSRQKKYAQAMQLSREVVGSLKNEHDTSGTLGLAYSSLGSLHQMQKRQDSLEIYFKLALQDFSQSKNTAYLPNAYLKIGQLAQQNHDKTNSLLYLQRALSIADSTENQQARVSAMVALGKWQLDMENNEGLAENYFGNAKKIASGLSDKMFEIKVLEALIALKTKQYQFAEASALQNDLLTLKDNFYSLEREQIVKSLEVQFDVSEKDRKLSLISKEREVSRLMNILLAIGILILVLLFTMVYFFLKRINKKDKELLKTQEELVAVLETQKQLKEQQFQNDLEHKENQLSAITLQMLQKNELLEEIKSTIEKETISEQQLLKMVNKHFTQGQSWNDFDKYFESLNKNFYTRLKQKYPEISSNDLKICALIKLNLSIKEMASILNISPDSVKTARYRLRKKLQLATEENLTDFILSI